MKKMKVAAALVLAGVMIFAAACGETVSDGKAAQAETEETAEETVTEEAAAEESGAAEEAGAEEAEDTADEGAEDGKEGEEAGSAEEEKPKSVTEIVSEIDTSRIPEDLGKIELGEYKGIDVYTKKPKEVTDEDIKLFIINNVYPMYSGEPSEELLKALEGKYESYEAFMEEMQWIVATQTEEENTAILYYDALEAVAEGSVVEPSETAIEWQLDALVLRYAKELEKGEGILLETYLDNLGRTYESMRNDLRPTAVIAARQVLIMNAIIEKEGFEVTEEDIAAYAEQHGVTAETLKSSLEPDALETIIKEQMAGDLVVNNANIIYTDEDAASAAVADADKRARGEDTSGEAEAADSESGGN